MTSSSINTPSAESDGPARDSDRSIQDLYKSVFESLNGSLVVFDQHLKIIEQNQSARILLVDTRNVADALSELIVDGAVVDWATEIRQIIQTQRSRYFDARTPQDKDQPEIYLSIAISPLRRGDHGEAIGGLLWAEDISSRISMERRLAVSERLAAVGKLAARVAHELNNPLDGILRYTNLTMRHIRDLNDSKALSYLEQTKSGILRMTQIIGALLEFSRSAPDVCEHATINKIVEDAMSSMEGRARDAKVTFVCNFHQTDMPVVRGSSLFQVFCNLIKNAIDAMPDSGTLTITTNIIDPDVVITFEDTGEGLPEDVDRIFEAFFSTKEPGKGTGLGLAVSKDIIERYGGTLTAARRPLGGAVFTVKIPLRNCAAPPPEARRSFRNNTMLNDCTM